jgi:hypothetical protein
VGNSWSNTSISSLTLPTGATSGARIVLDGTTDTILVYDAANNLIMSVAPDVEIVGGMQVLAGLTSQTAVQFANIFQGNIELGGVTAGVQDQAHAALIFPTPGAGALAVQSGTTVAHPDRSGLLFLPGVGGAVTGAGNNPQVFLGDLANTSDADLNISGSVVKTVGNVVTTWQTPSYNTGWAAGPTGGTTHAVQFRLDALDNLVVVGTMHTTSATPSATAFTLPAGWRTLSQWRSIVNINSGSGFAQFNTNGDVAITTNPAASGVDVHFTVTLPLGHLP